MSEVEVENVSKVEDVEDEMPSLESVEKPEEEGHEHDHEHDHEKRQNRTEKKIRKLLLKTGLKSVDGILRIVTKKDGKVLFSIHRPDVFKSPQSDTYVAFGNAELDNQSYSALQNAAENFTTPNVEDVLGDEVPSLTTVDESTKVTEEDEGEVDAEGLNEADIELVMSQGNTTRAKAIRALKKNNGDVVNSIMDVTME